MAKQKKHAVRPQAYKFSDLHISDLHKVNDKFKKHFGIGFKPFYDVLSPFLGQLSIDILKFDEWLHKQIGDYEDEGMSMSEAIIKHYGNQANDLVDALC